MRVSVNRPGYVCTIHKALNGLKNISICILSLGVEVHVQYCLPRYTKWGIMPRHFHQSNFSYYDMILGLPIFPLYIYLFITYVIRTIN